MILKHRLPVYSFVMVSQSAVQFCVSCDTHMPVYNCEKLSLQIPGECDSSAALLLLLKCGDLVRRIPEVTD